MSGNKILFGAARMGIDYYSEHKEEVSLFFDNDPCKWGQKIGDVTIQKPEYLGENYRIVVANDKHDIDMVTQLLELGYRKFSVIYPKGNAIGKGAFGEDTFDYSAYEDFSVNNRKVALLMDATSGSNTWCFKYVVDKYLKDECFDMILLNRNGKDEDYYYHIFTSKFLVLVSSYTSIKNKIIIQCYHAFPLKSIGYLDKSVTDTSFELTHRDILKSNYILSYSKFYNLAFGACFGVPINRFLEIGMPRNDVLLLSEGRKHIEKLIPDATGKRILVYMPTYRERVLYSDEEMKGYIFQYPDFDVNEFNSFLEKHNCIMLIKMHPEDTKRFSFLQSLASSIRFFTNDDFTNTDFYSFLNGTDMLLTDYSSVAYDYLLLDKPIIFSHLDVDRYIEERGLLYDADEFWFPGPHIVSISELESEIEQFCQNENRYSDERLRLKKLIHGDYKGDSCQKLLSVMRKELEQLEK